ncbi:MAG: carboxypeptidase-like regulatory domain-containing protein, partial [Balneolaceae bacterium]|nr:carboxypeptidase-like regulatory domain-containing protein [Balneolaceae bacterium]
MYRAITVIAALFVFLFMLSSSATAQQAENNLSFEFKGESLSMALDRIISKTDIDLVYDPQLTQNITVYKRISAKNADELLQQLLKDHQLDYITLSSGTYVIVKSVMEGPFYGTFAGKVVDSETGEPLPGATVMLADASGGTSTNQSGNFSISKLLTGTHQIIFSYVGYEPVSKTIEIRPNRELTEKISLNQKPVDVLPVVVEAHRAQISYHQNPLVAVHSDWETVGVMKDAIRNLSLISGVQYGLPMTDLHLQGGQHGEHRISLDGAPVYNPYSFGQMFSSFSPYAIGEIQLHKTGYGVKAGSQIAGLIDLSHDLPATGTKNVTIQSDPLSANLRGDLSFTTGDDSSLKLMTALRTNFWDIYKHPTFKEKLQDWNIIDPLITNALTNLEYDASIYSPIHHESEIKFFDYHLAGAYEINNFNSISASLYIAENIFETHLLNQAEDASMLSAAPYLYASEGYKWNNYTSQVTWSQMLSPRLDLSTQAIYSVNQFEHQNKIGTSDYPVYERNIFAEYSQTTSLDGVGERLPTHIDGNQIQHFIIKTDGSYSISPHLLLQAGVQFDRVISGIDISELTYFPAHINHSSTLLSTYLNNRHTFGRFWKIDWGSRFTYAALPDRFYAEPRFSVQFDKPESKVGYWSAKLSGGLYRQFINEYQITNSGPTSLVPTFAIWSLSDEESIPKAWHLNGSYLVEPRQSTSIKIELFYKWQPVTNITAYTTLNSAEAQSISQSQLSEIGAFAEATQMKALGGSLRFNQSFLNFRLKTTAGYDYSYSEIDMASQFGRNMPAPWNEPHRTQLRALWRMLPNLAITTKWQGIWGRSWAFR